MAEPFRNLLGPASVDRLADALSSTGPGFDAGQFRQVALDDLEALEFKARALQIAAAPEATLPTDFAAAADQPDRVNLWNL